MNASKPELIIDECLRSEKLVKALKKADIEYKFLGRGLLDMDIESYMFHNNAVLVTEDVEFNTHFPWDRSLLMSSRDPTPDKIRLIKAFMERFNGETNHDS